MSTILIVGADSMIGQQILMSYSRSGHRLISTTRRVETVSETRILLDLAGEPDEWDLPVDLDAVIICASVARMATCYEHPTATRKIHVDGMAQLATRLAPVYTLYLSTDKVFDGRLPHRQAESPYSPMCEYGRQKAAFEQALFALNPNTAVLRLSKVLNGANGLFEGWRTALLNGEVINPFYDFFLAPVHVVTLCAVVQAIVAQRGTGIWQLTGDEDVSYAQVAQIIARYHGVSDLLIQPVSMSEVLSTAEPIGPFTTLQTTRLQQALGLVIPSSTSVLADNVSGSV